MVGGVILIIVLGLVYGPQLLIRFSLGIEGLHNASTTATTGGTSDTYVAPPSLNPLVPATNSAQINVSGYASAGQTVKLYVNGSFADQAQAKSDGSFAFSDVTLAKGTNSIKAKAASGTNAESNFSNLVTISYLSQNPTLTIDQPQDGQHFSHDANNVEVS